MDLHVSPVGECPVDVHGEAPIIELGVELGVELSVELDVGKPCRRAESGLVDSVVHRRFDVVHETGDLGDSPEGLPRSSYAIGFSSYPRVHLRVLGAARTGSVSRVLASRPSRDGMTGPGGAHRRDLR